MADKEKIRPLYSELQGYLSEAPDHGKSILDKENVLKSVNQTIDNLNEVTGEDYSRFKMDYIPFPNGSGGYISTNTYRTKLGGLISYLHGSYFSDEQPPFSGMPSTVITQSQEQSQSFQVELLLQIQSKIDEQLPKFEPGDKRRGFLEKVKASLTSIRDTAALVALILSTGKQFGLTLDELSQLFT